MKALSSNRLLITLGSLVEGMVAVGVAEGLAGDCVGETVWVGGSVGVT